MTMMNIISHTLWNIRGFANNDNVSCYVNVTIQCMFHSPILRQILFRLERTNVMRKLIDRYTSNDKILDTTSIRRLAGNQYIQNNQQDASEFITHLINNISSIKSRIEHHL